MEETIRGRAEWGDRYIAFTNYDLQVLDVSEYFCTLQGSKKFEFCYGRVIKQELTCFNSKLYA